MEKILVIDDEKLIRLFFQQSLSARGFDVLTADSGEKGFELYMEEAPDIVLLDLRLPGMDGMETLSKIKEIDNDALVIMITAHGLIQTAVKAMKMGAYDFIEKPFEPEKIIHLLQKALETSKLKREVQRLRDEQKASYGFDHIIGKSKAIQAVFDMMEKIVQSDTSIVLLQGESGTGKDVIARIIHFHSSRSENAFVEVNCTSLPESLIESELFGHEKSAFTDAKTMKKGLFEVANNGTILLDEIGDMSLATQAKLLRVIESKRFKRIGGVKDIQVDTRVIAATNKDLAAGVKDGSFREDLYYRLMVIPIYLPPLRDRREDIIPLVKFFIEDFNKNIKRKKTIKYISPEAEALLNKYGWPGNIRELRNIIERIIILETGDTLLPEYLPAEFRRAGKAFLDANSKTVILPEDGISLEQVEESLIKQALNMVRGNQTRAAEILSLSRDTLRYRMKKFGL
ncbi:MAG: sigma-54-dependent transcriptional regulator [Thermodesulfobacteriota bacterium]